MYLTDYREASLKDVITQLEPSLFKKVTGLTVKDFELLVSLGLFNDKLMNESVYKFRRYESSSLEYAGIRMHSDEESVGLFSTSITRADYDALAKLQGLSTTAERNSSTNASSKPVKAPETPRIAPQPVISNTAAVKAEPAKKQSRAPQINVGDNVHHNKFGDGYIKTIEEKKTKFRVAFNDGTIKLFTYPDAFTNGFITLK